ncbi:MAG: triacylglycerol lipase [Clostridiales bacterium]|nr:triacylglycerol lipase [Clostridiales bacterium]
MCVYTLLAGKYLFGFFTPAWWIHVAAVFFMEFCVFWNGILRVYCTATMLGAKWRVLGIIFGFVPVANLVVLYRIIAVVRQEVHREEERELRNQQRQEEKVCATRYPVLLVHGVFFRDARFLNYWGRIPGELERNGAQLFYGHQQSALSVCDSAKEIAETIREIVDKIGCEKVNIVAHSKGGLDCRYAITHLGVAPLVASLTTINTPHQGCLFADWLLDRAPVSLRNRVARVYNATLRKLGDTTPDFLSAVEDLRASACQDFNQTTPDCPGVYYQSVGSCINRPLRGVFPLNLTYAFVRHFDGPNDGLVNLHASQWGERFIRLTSSSPDGISHADVIDLARRDKPDFDVREFYVCLLNELKNKGL